jgi:hypothetical protein
MAKKTSKTSAKFAKKAADNNHEESDTIMKQSKGGSKEGKGRDSPLSADRCENQGAE